MAMLAAAVIRMAISRPSALPALCAGMLFIAAAATMLGVVSANPKTFVILFLTFWYVVVNDRGRTPALDFAAFYATPRAAITVAYGSLAMAFVIAALGFYRVRLWREG